MLDDPELAAKSQPMPTGDGIDVAASAARKLRALGHEDIANDIEARIRLGEKKYGTRLKSNNGRNAYLDLYQEILDGINYSEQLVIEGREGDGFFLSLVGIAVEAREKLHISRAANGGGDA
jgi:hypothetical protein